ncbi:virulence-associated E family protein [Paenibacillus motobuensis]|uniref:virulence-associated E family protein n=1 Tax=Paenibacillus TaxID=44249 RepID=UPI00203D2AAE|nr:MULTISPECIES: virulence-associated E family protein [Paenibacillus]MCM3041693.1 virulence-associated E family protein [Paenibacillus lutimineralis]MCM3648797.1 virulence-associated E family protein [Paenibacillus motobuensis]
MQYDRQLTISSAGSRNSTNWQPQVIYWSELVERLRTATRGTETLAEYLRLPKTQQDDLKDVGGFVAGALTGGRRKAGAVTGRDVITLDLDNIPAGATADILRRLDGLGCAYAVYSTRKHEEAKPRLRVLAPLNRTVSADEYEPLARKLAAIIGIELCDPTTFQVTRLMYWPSCSADSQYVFTYGDKPFLSADGLLSLYADWRNWQEWPQVPGTQQAHVRMAAKQGDPTTKPGIVGAFCRIYDVSAAIETFLPGIYTIVDDGSGRLTYIGGSTTGGAIIYDDGQFLYSHHATDPCSGRLVNAFDLVRLHKFGDQDDDAKPGTPTNKLPSYTAMTTFAMQQEAVAGLLMQERYERAVESFGETAVATPDNMDWMQRLEINSNGMYLKTVDNVLIVLEYDPVLKGKIAFDEFANRGLVLGLLPWDPREERRPWASSDDAGIYHYIEKVYGIAVEAKINNALTLVSHKHRFNDVQRYLEGLQWDGIPRLDTLLTDYLGAEDSVYTRAVARKSFTAAVARAMVPGFKYDYMPILAGPQGLGKSTFLRLMGKNWYSDSLTTFEGKEACEMIQGIWINEVGELTGMSKSESNAVKQFLSRTEDIYREAYGKRTMPYPRRCVFFGTTNDSEFLRDRTGNRRFWPVDVGLVQPTKSVFRDLAGEVDQIYAEAFVRWQLGEQLYLTGEAEELSKQQQEAHRESSAKEGIIRAFVDRPVPEDWQKRDIPTRLMYWGGEFGKPHEGVAGPRDRICAAEIWCECFRSDIKFIRQSDTREINGILASIPGWEEYKGWFGPYNWQRGFRKK